MESGKKTAANEELRRKTIVMIDFRDKLEV